MDFETFNQISLEDTTPFSITKRSEIKQSPQFQMPKMEGYYPGMGQGDPKAEQIQDFIQPFRDAKVESVGDMKWDPTPIGGPKVDGSEAIAWLDSSTYPDSDKPFKDNKTLRYLITKYENWPGNLDTTVYESLEEMQHRLEKVAKKLDLYDGHPFKSNIGEIMRPINDRRRSEGDVFVLSAADKESIRAWVDEYDRFTGIKLTDLYHQLGQRFQGKGSSTPRESPPIMNTTDYALIMGIPFGLAAAAVGVIWPGVWSKVKEAQNSGRWKTGFVITTILMSLGTIPIYRLILGIKEGKVSQMENMEDV